MQVSKVYISVFHFENRAKFNIHNHFMFSCIQCVWKEPSLSTETENIIPYSMSINVSQVLPSDLSVCVLRISKKGCVRRISGTLRF